MCIIITKGIFMSDQIITLKELKDRARAFIAEREWVPFHSPKNLSMNISVEAAELMEKFLWLTTQESIGEVNKNRKEIEDELADILFSVLCFSNVTDIDLSTILERKMKEIGQKYPIEKSKGIATKYNKL